jgi:hypothetical protein
MKLVLITALALSLAACSSTPKLPEREAEVVKDIRYVVAMPPAELFKLPPQPAPIKDLDTAKQSDVATWLAASEARMEALENRIKEIAKFLYEAQESADKKAKEEINK